jgi:hypothetical protein
MKKHINLLAVVMFLVALAAFVAATKLGHPVKGGGYGFFSGG